MKQTTTPDAPCSQFHSPVCMCVGASFIPFQLPCILISNEIVQLKYQVHVQTTQ